MKLFRTAIAFGAAAVALLLASGTVYLLGNHLFEWSVDKVSFEWPTTVFFAVFYEAIGVVSAGIAIPLLGRRSRLLFLVLFASSVALAWAFVCVKFWRANAGYLWLIVPLPLLCTYLLVRIYNHRRTTRAG